ncbi:hypothetical protein EUGRSUZ_J03096 [Eucalyptus grandis]|uniref:Uncharacterized protein n=2 Tax=Eucalyptus grandis TaxID=71139 RepID=A0ACC3JAI5_EUCGR|nr:hypothetical protein EUGRSUZ_J03096 [Eucalyptus grandis]
MAHSHLICAQLLCSCLLLAALLMSCFIIIVSAINDTNRLALFTFKVEITRDPFGLLNSWNDSTNFYRWYGVICDRRHHRVIILDLHSKELSEPISSHIGNLNFLRLNISSCTNLLDFHFHYNYLVGGIPVELGFLSNLQKISFAMNRVTSSIPSFIGNLSSLKLISCSFNDLNIGFTLPNLQIFSIVNNHFTGSIPSSISNSTNLMMLQLSGNELSRKVPSLANLCNIEALSIFYNYLGSGRSDVDDLNFLCSLTNAANLRKLLAHENRLGGTLHVCIGNLSATLIDMSLGRNLTSGEISREINKLVNLQRLLLFHNLRLKGLIPSYLVKYQSLTYLDLSSNYLSGPVIFPVAGNLLYLNLSRNHLSGVLPMKIGNLKHLVALDVSGNILDGEIPSNLSNCDGLTILRMRDNLFHGSIPQPINSLRSIEELDLSNNSFSSEIPKFLEAFQYLEVLNLSYNRLEGLLPTQGVFRNVSATFVAGNEKLCGGMPKFELPECVSRNSKNKGRVHKLKLIVTILFSLLGITLIVTFLYLCWLKMKRNEPISSSLDDSINRCFSLTNLIGVRSFGSVYKGLLQENRIVIVVKVLNFTRHDALKSLKAECEALKRIDYKGDEFKALVCEFMVNGSLDEWVHPNLAPNDAEGHSKKLSLLQRINISLDVASALEYLHYQCESPIIHWDLKPSVDT